MTSRDFCYWLQGFFEIAHSGPNPVEPNSKYNLKDYQIEMIRNHLAMVFKAEIDPSFKPGIQSALDHLHKPHKPLLQDGVLARC